MTSKDCDPGRRLAEAVAGEVMLRAWHRHGADCGFTRGNKCDCRKDSWFSGVRWTVCVTPEMRAFVHSLH